MSVFGTGVGNGAGAETRHCAHWCLGPTVKALENGVGIRAAPERDSATAPVRGVNSGARWEPVLGSQPSPEKGLNGVLAEGEKGVIGGFGRFRRPRGGSPPTAPSVRLVIKADLDGHRTRIPLSETRLERLGTSHWTTSALNVFVNPSQ